MFKVKHIGVCDECRPDRGMWLDDTAAACRPPSLDDLEAVQHNTLRTGQ